MEIVVMYSGKIQKWNKFTMKQERNFVVTNLNVYNFKGKSKVFLDIHPMSRFRT